MSRVLAEKQLNHDGSDVYPVVSIWKVCLYLSTAIVMGKIELSDFAESIDVTSNSASQVLKCACQ